MRKYYIYGYLWIATLLVIMSYGCSTGIESTRKITYSRADKKSIAVTAEEKLMDSIHSEPVLNWLPGRPFLVADNRASIVYESESKDSIKGKTFYFRDISQRTTPGGYAEAVISFTDGKDLWQYGTSKNIKELDNLTSFDMPMLIDLQSISEINSLLQGRRVWTRSHLWYDENGDKFFGTKFAPVVIDSIMPGDKNFAMRVAISTADHNHAYMYMNFANSGADNRTFADLFLLHNPRTGYKHISDEVWQLICAGKVREGMTKEECKLSLGNPKEVNQGHNWNNTIDIWHYSDGTYLRFVDGLLIKDR